jgi:hypothetical protein
MYNNYRFVNSTAIKFVAYDAFLNKLLVIFQSGTAYEYSNVPATVYQNIAAATSVGLEFSKSVRRQYTCTRRLESLELAEFMLAVAEREYRKGVLSCGTGQAL